MTAIEVKNLTYVYNRGLPDEVRAVDDISLCIEQGEFVGIIGHTGSGKSTFIQTLNGLLKPEGEVLIFGENIFADKKTLASARFNVGLVFQYPEYQLFEETVYDDVAFGPKNMGLSDDEVKQRVTQALGFVGLGEDIFARSPFELSGGQKRRVAIAGVIAMKPKVLILDEPASGLDPSGRAEILDEIKEFHRASGTTVLLISHSMDDVAKYAERVMVINKGRLFALDTVENIFARAAELEEMGLAVPQITQVFLRLREAGFDVPKSVYTVDYAAKRMLLALKGGEPND